MRANIIAKSGKAVEVAGDIDTLLLDKTGTITHRQPPGDASSCRSAMCRRASSMRLAALASVADQTPEGKSIVEAYAQLEGLTTGRRGAERRRNSSRSPPRRA